MESTKNIYCAKARGAVDHTTIPDDSRNFSWVVRTLTIRKSQAGLKPQIPWLCSKPQMQIQEVALREYQVSFASYSHFHDFILKY